MNFLLDEDFPKSVVPLLEGTGHVVLDFREMGAIGAPDEDVLHLAIERDAVILSTDRDFFHTIGRKMDNHPGMIVVALKQPTRVSILARIEWFIENVGLDSLSGRVFQLRDKTWMVYPPLPADENGS